MVFGKREKDKDVRISESQYKSLVGGMSKKERKDFERKQKEFRGDREEYDHDRKAVAMTIKDSPYAWAGFKAIGNEKDITDIMAVLAPANVEKLIVEYPEISN